VTLSLEEKQAIVAEVAEVAAKAHSAVCAEYAGLSSNQMNSLRQQARKGGVYLRVVKNTLARLAVKGTEFECMVEAIKGPMILAFSQDEPGAAARVFKAFVKENQKLVVKVIAIGGKMLGPADLERLASLPTKDQAISILMSCMQAPITKLARTLNEIPGKMVRTVAAVGEQKKAAG
jgi:large subunit ribosomal protein L10